MLRTAESFGIQHVWTLEPAPEMRKHTEVCRKVDKGCSMWMSLRAFTKMSELITALRADGREIWAADLAPVSGFVCVHASM